MIQHTEQEVKPCKFVNGACVHCEATEQEECEGWICPPKRPWQGLTDDDWEHIGNKKGTALDTFAQGVAWAAARLKEKNT